ncbi:MAG: helix-turn-helix domain-containing protein [Kiritimatiellales bacterium]|nr:helix-turn-helix domain-containing protein [Kiritimatiellales bacterium]
MSGQIPTIHSDYVFSRDELPLATNFNPGHPDYPVHRHEFEELVVIKEGFGINIVDGIDHPLQAGDVFLIPRGRAHAYSHMNRLYSYNIYFDARKIDMKRWTTRALPGFQALFVIEPSYRHNKEFNSRLRLDQAQLLRIWSLAESLDQTLADKKPGFRLIALARFMEIVGLLSRYYEETSHSDSRKVLQVAEAISHMEIHFADEITVEDLARIAHMSPRNLQRLFLAATGKTPTAYLIGLRVIEAAHLLETPGKTITEIAFECGFQDSNYFSRQFRNLMNESPTEFRKRIS